MAEDGVLQQLSGGRPVGGLELQAAQGDVPQAWRQVERDRGAVVALAIWERRGGSVEWISLLPNTFKVITQSLKFSRAFFSFFVFLILSYQNACYGCENAENRTWGRIHETFLRRNFFLTAIFFLFLT